MFRFLAILAFLAPALAEAQAERHRVVPGETLWGIAGQYYDAPWRWPEIFEANRTSLADPALIRPGQELVIPAQAAQLASTELPARDAGTDVHRVTPGETLWSIAGSRYGTPWRWPEIHEANRASVPDPHWIRPGQELIIPGGGPPVTVATAPATPPAEPVMAAAPDPEPVLAAAPAHPVEPLLAATPAPEPVAAAHEPAPIPSVEHAAPPEIEPHTRTSAYEVRPGDLIETAFYTAAARPVGSVDGSRVVDQLGNVFYPYIGAVHVAGLDATTIRAVLEDKFGELYNEPVITLDVKLRVNVTGMVGAPGRYLLDPTATVLDALSSAGGVGNEIAVEGQLAADAGAVQLIRDGETTILDLRPEIATQATIGLPVQSGDWIHVPPQARSRFRDDVQFWGSLLSLVTSVVGALVLIGR